MSKRNQSVFSYNYLDSQRLKDTFFSAEKKEPPLFKKIIPYVIGGTGLITITLIVIFNYDFIIVKHQNLNAKINTSSLLKNPHLISIKFIEPTKGRSQITKGKLHLTIPAREKTAVQLNFNDAINVYNSNLTLYLKKSSSPLKLAITLKDTTFHSNSIRPIIIDLKETNNLSYIKIPIDLDETALQNTNLNKINQINIFLYPQDKKTGNWVIIKDILLNKIEPKS